MTRDPIADPDLKRGARLAERMQAEILHGAWPVGRHLGSEPQLMARYGVSRSTLREAVRQLEAHGSIRMRRGGGGGLIVAEPPDQSAVRALATYLELIDAGMDELLEARLALEVSAAGYAARRADDAQIAELRALAGRLNVTRPSREEIGVHVAIRDLIAEMSGNPALAMFTSALNRSTVQAVGPELGSGDYEAGLGEAAQSKRGIVDAIVARDPAGAQSASRADLEIRHQALLTLHRRTVAGEAHRELAAGSPPGRGLDYDVKLGQALATRIAHQIVREDRPEGEKLGAEPELVARYGVGRGIFREAVRILEAHGLVRTRRGHRGGLMVGRPDPAYTVRTTALYLEHLQLAPVLFEDVRAAASVTAARLAAQRGTAEQREILQRLLEREVPLDGRANMEAGSEMLRQIGEMSGNRALALIIRVVMAVNWRLPLRTISETEVRQSRQLHHDLAQAIIAGDEPLAQGRMVEHLRSVRRWLTGLETQHHGSSAAIARSA